MDPVIRLLSDLVAINSINPTLVDMDKANAEFPNFPEYTLTNTGAVHTAFFFSSPGSV